jgi:hypothetical protein
VPAVLSRILVTALFLLFCTAVALVTVGLATRREYHLVLRDYLILNGDVYLYRRGRGGGVLLDVSFALMLAFIGVSGAALVLWKLRRRTPQTGRGFEISISN